MPFRQFLKEFAGNRQINTAQCMVPEVRELDEQLARIELARIEKHLEALGKHAPGEDSDE